MNERIRAILGDIEAEHRRWRGLLGCLSPEEASERPDGGWSAVDSLIHIAAWKENALTIARSQAESGAPELDPKKGSAGILGISVDAFNDEVARSHQDWSLDRATAWADRVDADLRAAIAALPDQRVIGGRGRHGARFWISLPGMSHPPEHRRELELRFPVP